MKWFKHDANASIDSKLQRVKLKYGMEGYGLYWYLLECIARTVDAHNLSFELEEDAELISAATNIHHERVEEMMRFMVSIKLFDASSGRIFCLKMAERADEYTQKLLRNSEQNKLLTCCPDNVPTVSGQSPSYKNRIEEKRREEKEKNTAPKKPRKSFKKPTVEEIAAYCSERGNHVNPEQFFDHYEAKGWMVGKSKMKDWRAAVRTWERNGYDRKEEPKLNFVPGRGEQIPEAYL